MTRRLFEVSGVRRRNGNLATGVVYAVYSNEAGTVLANISATVGGSAISGSTVTVADIAGLGPSALRFYGPTDDTDTLYLKSTADASLGVQKVEASTDERLDALEAGSASGIPGTIVDAKGDLLAASAADTPAKLTVGANGTQLLADSSQTAGLKWLATPVVNVKAPPFNAVGNGVANDTTALNAARDAAGTNGEVVVPNGTYLVDTLELTVAGQRWRLGPRATIKLKNSAGHSLLYISATDVTVEGGTFDGNKSNQSTASSGVAVETGAHDVRLQGLSVLSAKTYGILIGHANRVTVQDCRVFSSDNIGILALAGAGAAADMTDLTIDSCYVDRDALGSGITGGGIQVHGANPRKLIGAKIRGNTVRMPASPSGDCLCIEAYDLSERTVIEGNYTFNGSMGISLQSADSSTVAGNTIHSPRAYGVEVASTKYAAITGNTIDGNSLSTHGIIFTGSASNYAAITGNTIRNFPAATTLILLQSGALYATIAGNVFHTGSASHGIYVNALTAGYFTITGNTFSGGSNGVVLDTTWDGVVSGNTMNGASSKAIGISGSSGTFNNIAITGNHLSGNTATITSALSGSAVYGSSVVIADNAGEPKNWLDYGANIFDGKGAGTPESAVTAGIGSTWRRTNGGAVTTLYVKESGTGNTGWVAK